MRPLALVIVGLLVSVRPCGGQDTARPSALAIGVRLGNERLLQTGDFIFDPAAATITGIVPAISIALGGARRGLLVEPSVSYWRRNDDVSLLQLGLGVERHVASGDMSPFVGARWTLHVRSSDTAETPFDHVLSLLFGGDYFLAERFTIGGEVSVNHAFLEETDPGRRDITYTDAALRFRFHLR